MVLAIWFTLALLAGLAIGKFLHACAELAPATQLPTRHPAGRDLLAGPYVSASISSAAG